jgi:hypothetical protein
MKKPTKVILALIVLIVGLACYVWYLHSRDPQLKPNPIGEVAKKNIQTEAKQIAIEVDKNGLNHTILKIVKEIDHDAIDKVNADLLDTIDALNIARDKIRQVTVVNTSLVIQKQYLERQVSGLATTYNHKDKFFNLSVNVPRDSTQAASFEAGYDADLVTAQYNKRKFPFFGSSDTYMNIYSNDPRFTIRGARVLSVKQNAPAFGFEARAKANFNNFTGPSAGPGIKIRIGRFDLDGDYQYYSNQKSWTWGVGAAYRIGGF